MLEFIKMFGLGILYTVLSPFILAFFLLFVIYSFFNYLVCEAIYLGGFFLGIKFDDKTALEKKLMKMRKEKEELKQLEIQKQQELLAMERNKSEEGDFNA